MLELDAALPLGQIASGEPAAEVLSLLRGLLAARGTLVPESRLQAELRCSPSALNDFAAQANDALARSDGRGAYIAHYPGHGFCLVRPAPAPPGIGPARGEVYGREAEIDELAAKLRQHRLVTIVGHGGMGKTTLALEFGRRHAAAYRDGWVLIDLAPVRERAHVTQAFARAIAPASAAPDDRAALRNALAGKQQLLVVDNCEHLVGAVAEIVEELLGQARTVTVLATSREPLLSRGEQLLRIHPLGLPAAASRLSAEAALAHPALRLFVDRARRLQPGFEPRDGDVARLSHICQLLEGMPFAIELAAARVEALGLVELERQLAERPLSALSAGRRPPPGRHDSVLDMLAWSHALLNADEQRVLHRLSVFHGRFTWAAARHVAADEGASPAQVDDCILALVEKSIVAGAGPLGPGQLKLLDLTRHFASTQLAPDLRRRAQARHAGFLLAALDEASAAWETLSHDEWRRRYAYWIDDVRGALDWAFSADGDSRLGVALTLAVYPLAAHAGLMVEFEERAAVALQALQAARPRRPLQEARLHSLPVMARPRPLMTDDPCHDRLLWSLAVSRRLGTVRDQLAPTFALWLGAFLAARYEEALGWLLEARRLVLAHGDQAAAQVVDRALAQAWHYGGRHQQARETAQAVMACGPLREPILLTPSSVPPRVSMLCILARSSWIQGLPDQAREATREALSLAREDHPNAVCCAIATAALPVALWRGDLEVCEGLLAELREAMRHHHAPYWSAWAGMYEQVLRALGDPDPRRARALPAYGPALAKFDQHVWTFRAGRVGPAVIAAAAAGRCGWSSPELLRAGGEADSEGGHDSPRSETLFRQALAQASQHGATGWALRAATSLAQHLQARARADEARAVLEPVFASFREGLDTADLRAAQRLLCGRVAAGDASGDAR